MIRSAHTAGDTIKKVLVSATLGASMNKETQLTRAHLSKSSHLHVSYGGLHLWHYAMDSACLKSTATETTTIRSTAHVLMHTRSTTDHTHTSGHTPCGAPKGAPIVSASGLHRVVCAPSWRAGLPPRTLARPFASLKHPRFARLGRLSPATPGRASPPPCCASIIPK